MQHLTQNPPDPSKRASTVDGATTSRASRAARRSARPSRHGWGVRVSVLAVVALCATGFAACGGDSSDAGAGGAGVGGEDGMGGAGGDSGSNTSGSGASTSSDATTNSSASSSSGGSTGTMGDTCSIMSSNKVCAGCLEQKCCDVLNACKAADLFSCYSCLDCFLEGNGPECCDQDPDNNKNHWLVECVAFNCEDECS